MPYIVIPVYNEVGRIGAVVHGLRAAGFLHIIVVDDGSTDASAQVAQEAGALVLRHVVNRGQGAALQTGDEYARRASAPYVVHFDGDGQFDPSDIAPALDFMKLNKLDVVLGSRFLDHRTSMPLLKRWFLLPVGRMVNRVFTGLQLTDGQNGFRILSRAALEKITITHDGMAHNSEINRAIVKNKLSVAEFPVHVTYHRFGQGLFSGVKTVRDLLLAPWL